jgi:hypothetical protein
MDNLILTLRPSQWINIGWIVFGIVGLPLIVPPLIALYKMFETYNERYDFYEDVVIMRKGIFDVTTRELHYHRIKSFYVEEPFLYRWVGIGHVLVRSSDMFSALFQFNAVPHVEVFLNDFKSLVNERREEMGMKEYEVFQMN